MEFEWDPAKAASNLAKHGIGFTDATEIFDDPDVYITPDPRPYGEIRFQAIGIVKGELALVVYTLRGGGVYRIISARRANRRERKTYSLQARN
jgi:uncharacterized DUF497 family protein